MIWEFPKIGDPNIPRGSKVVPFWGSYIESYKAIPKLLGDSGLGILGL